MTVDLKELQKKIPPKQYNELLDRLQLQDICLKTVKASLGTRVLTEKVNLDYREEAVVLPPEGKKTEIEARYFFRATSGKKRVFNLDATYLVTLIAEADLPTEFFELYKTYSLPLHTFPYLRELVHGVISRMGLPPLILPLRKGLIGQNDRHS